MHPIYIWGAFLFFNKLSKTVHTILVVMILKERLYARRDELWGGL